MNKEDQIESIQVSIEQAQAAIDTKNAFNRLRNNEDYKAVIETSYFANESKRLVLLKADPSLQGPTEQANIDNGITAIGHFRQYLVSIGRIAEMMEKSITESEAVREEILQETSEG